MADINELHELCEILDRDIKEMNRKVREAGGKLNRDTLDYVDKLTHALKSVKTVIAMEEESGYSHAYGDKTGRVHWADGTVSYGDDDGHSYRGRGSRAKRDAMGRYSSDSYGGYSRDDARHEMMHELHELMEESDPSMRGEFQTFINKLERM